MHPTGSHRPASRRPSVRAAGGRWARLVACVLVAAALLPSAHAVAAPPAQDAAAGQPSGRCGDHPWCDPGLTPDRRATLLVEALTPDERIGLLAGDDDAG